MKSATRLLPLFLALVAVSTAKAGGVKASAIEYGTISSAVAQVLEEAHYSQHPLNEDVSRQFLTDYLEDLDADHLYFSRPDVEKILSDHAATLGKDVLAGRLGAAYDIFDLYKKRVNERVDKINLLIKNESFDFASDRTAELMRDHSPWPASDAEADQIWRDRIEGELLDEKLNGTALDDCKQTALSRYLQMRSELQRESKKDAMAILLNSLARAYDPHSEYLRKQDLDDLDSDMRLSMVGIGVVIETQGRYTRIVSLLPGSPAAADGRLKVNDRIAAIAKGDGEFVDIAGMSVDHVLALIRGKQGTRVRLKVIPARSTDASERKEVVLVSRNIDLIDEEAKAEVIERLAPDGKKERLGWITLPSFYGDPEQPNGRSLTRDVRALVLRLKRENVAGMVLDLRNNPGGELEEAVGVGGLFLGPVPIVQEKDRAGKIYVSKADGRQLYDGPLVVVTDHLTASAAELLASALQDYGRAVIVGGHYPTFGKGSVQTVVELGEVIRGVSTKESDQLGALQLTIAKFYRVNGQSTQLRGLTADVQLPSPEDLPAEGESGMKNPLQYDETKPVIALTKTAFAAHPLPLAQLKELSTKRTASQQEFIYLNEDLDRERKKEEANRISLNENLRRTERDQEKAREKEREAARKLTARLDETILRIKPRDVRAKSPSVASKAGEKQSAAAPVTDASPSSTTKPPDVIRAEALNILSDLVRFSSKKADPGERLVENSTARLDRHVKAP